MTVMRSYIRGRADIAMKTVFGLVLRFAIIAVCLLISSVPSSGGDRVYTLEDAYRAALSFNESVKISEEGLVQAESRVEQAFSYVYPRITGQAGYTHYNEVLPPDNSFVFQPLEEVRARLVLTQPIYTGGRTLAAYRLAKTLRDAGRYGLESVKQETIMNVAEAYYAVLRAGRLVEVSMDSLRRMERHRAVTEREATTRRTKANQSALLRANTLVSQASIVLTRAEDELRLAKRRLSFLTGLPEDAVLTEPESGAVPSDDIGLLTSWALENRGEYAAARMNRAAALENITIVKGAHNPQAFLEGSIQYLASDPDTMMDGTNYYGGLKLQIPIFEGGLMKAEAAEAKSKLRQAELQEALIRRSIETEVYEAWVRLKTTDSVLQASQSQYEDAQRNFRNIEALFSEGIASSLSLIDAQQALFIAEREYVNALYDRRLAVLRLMRSVGLLGKDMKVDRGPAEYNPTR